MGWNYGMEAKMTANNINMPLHLPDIFGLYLKPLNTGKMKNAVSSSREEKISCCRGRYRNG